MAETQDAQAQDAHGRGFDFRVVNQTVIAEYRETGGVLTRTLPGSRLLLLTTTGARSGRAHTTPLGYVLDGSARRLVVYASNMAAAEDPQWYRNLVADPKVFVELGSERFAATASTAVGEERARLHAALVEAMPGLRTHQEQTAREIPVVLLEGVP